MSVSQDISDSVKNKEYDLVFQPDGFIRYYDTMPLDLMIDIHNALTMFISYADHTD